MSYKEARQWMAYRSKHGGIGGARLAYLAGLQCTMYSNAHGGKATLRDFLPGLPEQDIVIENADQWMQLIGY